MIETPGASCAHVVRGWLIDAENTSDAWICALLCANKRPGKRPQEVSKCDDAVAGSRELLYVVDSLTSCDHTRPFACCKYERSYVACLTFISLRVRNSRLRRTHVSIVSLHGGKSRPAESWRGLEKILELSPHQGVSLRIRGKPTILTVGPGSKSSQALARAWIVGTSRVKVPKTSPRVRYRVRWARRGLPPTSSIGCGRDAMKLLIVSGRAVFLPSRLNS
jgi:hypothetical protein